MKGEELVLHRLALARAAVLEKAEYVAETLLNLTPVVIHDRPEVTMGVTKQLVLYVGLDFILHSPYVKTDAKMAGLLRHEVEHPLRGLDRVEAMPDPALANDAGDRAINFDLREEGWELPDCGLFPEQAGLPGGKHLEWYYDQLQKKCEEMKMSLPQLQQHLQQQQDEKEKGKGKGRGQGKDQEKDPSEESEGGHAHGPGVASGSCGGCGGQPIDAALEAELDEKYGKSAAEVEAIRRKTLEDIEHHIAVHGRGSVPGRFEELIKTKIRPPDVNWRQKLRQIARRTSSLIQSGGRDYSIRRPSMTGMFTGAVLSGLVDHPIIASIVVDTSGSMGEKQLMDAHNESFHIAKKIATDRVWLLHVDTDIHRCEQVRAAQIPTLPFKGRGGTDFRLAFQHLVKLRPRPNLVIYITDGDGIAPRNPPRDMEVIWCVVRTPYARKPAHWGHLVVCDKNQSLKDPVVPGPDE